MVLDVRTGHRSIEESSLIGLGVGGGVLAVYIVAGLLVADWNLSGFLLHRTPVTTAWAVAFGALVIASIAIPVTLYLRSGLRSPLALLVIALLGWFTYGVVTGVLTGDTAFGFTLYLLSFSPILVGLQLLLGGVEYYDQRRGFLR